jgi:hypothetical protein
MNREEEIRIIAYNIWEKGGNCHGRDVEDWLKAETIWQETSQPLKMASEMKPSVRDQQNSSASKTKPAVVFSGQQNRKDQFSKRKP